MTKWTAPDIASIRGDNSRPLQKIFGSLTEYLKDYQNTIDTASSSSSQTFVRNGEATTLTIGTVVYLDAQQGNRATVKRAFNTSDATSAKTLGVVAEDIPAHSDGLVTTLGYLEKVNTSAFTAGQTLYLSATAGQFTATKPHAPNHMVYVGVVVRANAGNGIIYVRCQNGYELDEIHDVLITSPTAGQILSYDAVSSLWKNTTFSDGSGLANLNASNLASGTVPTGRMTGAYTGITSVGTLGSLAVSGTINTSNGIMELGLGRVSNGYAYIDLIGDTTYTNFGLRLQRGNLGANTFSRLVHRGTGQFEITTQDAAPLIFYTTNTERMRIDSAGFVGIGTATPFQPAGYGALTIDGSSGSIISGRVAGTETFRIQLTAASTTLNNIAALPILFNTNNTERMRIHSAGSVAIGGAAVTHHSLRVVRQIAGNPFSSAILSDGQVQSGVTSRADYFLSSHNVASGTYSIVNGYQAQQGTLTGTVTTQRGFSADASLTGATNNYGFYGDIPSGTGRWNFYANGAAPNYMAGNLGIGTSSPTVRLEVRGSTTISSQNNVAATFGTTTSGRLLLGSITGNTPFIGSEGATNLLFTTNAVERMRITSAGDVNIGTANNYGKLNVLNTVAIHGVNPLLNFVNASNVRLGYLYHDGNISLINQTAGYLFFGTNNTERMRIDGAGLVGIGTNSPSYALHISRGTASVDAVATAVDVLGGNVGDSAGYVMRAANTNELGAIRSFVESSYLSSMRFYTAGATNVLSERMCITSAGSVGIKTASPAHTLDVNGTTRVTTGIVSGTGISYPGCTTGGGTANNMGLTWISSSSSIIGTVDNAVSAVLGTVSDRRFKANIETLQDGLSTVKQLRPVTYNPLDVIGFDENGEIIIGDNDPYDTVEGFVADEVEQVAPWLVLGGENGGYQSVNYALITPMLVRAVQELEQRLTELETV